MIRKEPPKQQPQQEVKTQANSIKIIELKDLRQSQPNWKQYVETHEVVVFYNPDCPFSKNAMVVLKELVLNNCLKDVVAVKVFDWNFVYNDLGKYKGISTLPQIYTKHKEKGIIVTDSTQLINAFLGNETNCTVKSVLFGTS